MSSEVVVVLVLVVVLVVGGGGGGGVGGDCSLRIIKLMEALCDLQFSREKIKQMIKYESLFPSRPWRKQFSFFCSLVRLGR